MVAILDVALRSLLLCERTLSRTLSAPRFRITITDDDYGDD